MLTIKKGKEIFTSMVKELLSLKIKTEQVGKHESYPYNTVIHIGEHGDGHYEKYGEKCLNCNLEMVLQIQKGLTLKTARDHAVCPECGCTLNGEDMVEKKD